MAAYFLDSSALVKRYAAETGSAWVENLTDPRSDNRIYVAAITHVEVIAAIARKKKGLLLSATAAAAAIARFENDLQTDLRVFDLTPTSHFFLSFSLENCLDLRQYRTAHSA